MAEFLRKIRSVELEINQKLFYICGFVTLVAMAFELADFFSRGSFMPSEINLFYLGVLAIYSLHKEFIRWIGAGKKAKNGEYFVYCWVILTVALYVVNFLAEGYFGYSAEGYKLGTLRDISILTLEVLGVFIITRSFKILEILFKR